MRPYLGMLMPLLLLAGAASAADDTPKPDAEQDKDKPKVRIYWDDEDSRSVFEADNAKITLQNRVQFRWTDELPDSKVQLPGTPQAGDARGSFKIRRAKTKVEGWAWKKELRFNIQLSWVGGDTGATSASALEDAEIIWDVSKKDTFRIQVGQYKVPFGRQEMTSSEDQQFLDRSILSGEFTHGRDQGVSIQGRVAGGKLDYAVGMFNGNQRNRPNNDNNRYQYDARVVFQPWGDVRYSESDFESRDKPLLALAAQFENNNKYYSTNADNLDTTMFGGDLVFKYRGFSAFGEYYWRKQKPQLAAEFKSPGFNLQAGYLIGPRRRLELAVRYARWDPTDRVSDNDLSELGGAVSYFLRHHHLKVNGDVRRLKDAGRRTTDHEVRLQAQLVF